MEVFRVHNRAYGPLDWTGAAVHGARWNPPGVAVIYTSRTYEGALLEQLVHAGIGRLPQNRVVSRIFVPDRAGVEELENMDDRGWTDEGHTRGLGAAWLQSRTGLALVVPSAVSRPYGRNVLVNPRHVDFQNVTVVETRRVIWDPRLTIR